ncbi:MAG: Fic family protein [Candidatus Kaiserbacteria bacterium]|nr:Fic family protein [Candidatus Kaiserbacteria bacterium]
MRQEKSKKSSFVSGSYVQQFHGKEYAYQSFLPSPINTPYTTQDKRIPFLLEEAAHHLAGLDAYADLVPDIEFFISMHVRNEAVKSSSIEGTYTGIDEVVLEEKEIAPEQRDDWKEVQNYITAMNYGVAQLPKLPICMRLTCEIHKRLMQGVRGEHKQPGEIRTQQNWIGGTSIKSASFIPPHPKDLSDTLKDLEEFWNTALFTIPNLIKVAMAHYQFEIIHPFNDGNGRVGRILIVLQLMHMGVLQKPVLYLSDFFEKNKGAYYDALTFVREQNDMDQWLLFFLSGITETAKKGKETLKSMLNLQREYEQKLLPLGRQAKTAHALLMFAFSKPAFDISTAAKEVRVSTTTATKVIERMVKEGMLKETTGFSRNKVFKLHHYIDLFKA